MPVLGERIKQLRRQCKLSQDEVADRINLSRSTINNIERGNQRPSVEFIIELSRITGESTDSILLGIEPSPSEWEHQLLAALIKESAIDQRRILANKIANELAEQKAEIQKLKALLATREADLESLRDQLATISDTIKVLSGKP